MAKTYPPPFKPIHIGNFIVPNRIKYAATGKNLNGHDGFVIDAGAEYMRRKAAVNPIGRETKR
jgi:2,4-dienoyl-CoA reductase-like NADH-dependent reductase (Old Yellow Enzyme family)